MRDVGHNVRIVYGSVNTVVYIKPASRTLAVGEKLTGAKVLGIQKGPERGIGDLVVGCQAESYRYVLDGLDVVLG